MSLKLTGKEGGTGVLEWGDPKGPVNILSRKSFSELEEVLSEIEGKHLKALVLISRHPSVFCAGADIKELKGLSKKDLAPALSRAYRIFRRLESLPAVKISAVHGACLGGGLEFILTCDLRLASNDPATRLGLPEVHLGLIPGFGGTFRLPRLLGLKTGLDLILSGRICNSQTAFRMGLVDELVPPSILRERAMKLAEEIIKTGASSFKRNNRTHSALWTENFLFRPFIFHRAKKILLKKTKGFYPAPLKAWSVIKTTYNTSSMETAHAVEKKAFLSLIGEKESRNLIRLFFLKNSARKKLSGPAFSPKAPVGVLGAGVMGGGIARLSADRGLPVRLYDVKKEALSKALKEAYDFWKEQSRRGHIDKYELRKKQDRLSTDLTGDGFLKTDLIIEALPENRNLKKKVIREIGARLNPSAVFAVNTSSLSVSDLATAFPRPEQFVGMHFFHPAHKMPLVEIVKTQHSGDSAIQTAFHLAKSLGKTPVLVKDCPGFIVNRLLAPYLSEALHFLKEGKNIEEVDHIYTHSFGLPLGPFSLMDEVGPDLCLAALENLEEAGVNMNVPEEIRPILKDLGPGRKGGKGFYIYGPKKRSVSPKILTLQKSGETIDPKDCVERGMYRLINEAFQILEEGTAGEEDIDLAMILGMGFPPFLGGPLKYAKDTGLKIIGDRLQSLTRRLGPRFTPHSSLKNHKAGRSEKSSPIQNGLE